MNVPDRVAQLIFTESTKIFFDSDVIQALLTTFDPNKPISVYVAAGKLGTGKSSHQNVVLKYLQNTLHRFNPSENLFAVKKTSLTFTKGVWVYPHPLFAPGHPNVQILLVDLEGMFALKEENKEDTSLLLTKIYLFGMLISSVFSLHTMEKVEEHSIEALKHAWDMCQKLRESLRVEPPKIYLLMKDVDNNNCVEETDELRRLIGLRLAGYANEANHLMLRGKGEVPKSFRDSNSEDCRGLQDTPYISIIQEIIGTIVSHPKKNPTARNTPIRINEFCSFVKHVCTLFNEEHFESKVSIEIDFMKYERMDSIYAKHLSECVVACQEMAKNELVETSIEDFEAKTQAAIEEAKRGFLAEITESIENSRAVEIWIEKQKAAFTITMKTVNIIETFSSRKIAVEQNEKQRQEYQAKIDQEKVQAESAKVSLQHIETQLREEKNAHYEEKARLEQEFQKALQKQAEDYIKELDADREKLRSEFAQKSDEQREVFDQKLSEQYEEIKRVNNKMIEAERQYQIEKSQLIEKMHADREELTDKTLAALQQQMADNQKRHEQLMAHLNEEASQRRNAMAQSMNKKRRTGILGFLGNLIGW